MTNPMSWVQRRGTCTIHDWMKELLGDFNTRVGEFNCLAEERKWPYRIKVDAEKDMSRILVWRYEPPENTTIRIIAHFDANQHEHIEVASLRDSIQAARHSAVFISLKSGWNRKELRCELMTNDNKLLTLEQASESILYDILFENIP